MKKMVIILMILTAVLIFTTGCNMPVPSAPAGGGNAEQTYAAETVAARLTANAADAGGDDDPADPPPATTEAPPDAPPTDTPTPTNTPTVTPTPTEDIPCNRVSFVKDVTVPDGKEYAPNTNFTKTWRLKNTGSCNWNNDYDLVFSSGDKMNGGDVVDITIGSVAPGDTVDISVDLKSPSSAGTYKGNWKLRSDDNQVFGLNDSGNPFYVEIKVVAGASFTILGSHTYACGIDNYASVQIKNTGSESLESKGGGYKIISSGVEKSFVGWNNTPFVENKDDCSSGFINDAEPGDAYYLTYNWGNSTEEIKITVKLCTEENGGGECATQSVTVDLP